jgi:hypothetical protein
VPGYYGAYEVFRYAEPFVTSRLFSEALVLTGLAMLLSGRRTWALATTLAAVLVHPLMGIAGLLVVATVLMRRRGPAVIAASVAAGIVLALALALVHPMYPIAVFDREWLELARSRSPFLLAQDWNAETWAAVARTVTLSALAGLAWGASGGQRLLICSATVALSGLVITLTGASMANIVLLVQGQSWRWLWLAQVLGVLAAPRVFRNLWVGGATTRGAVLLAIAGWLVTGWPAVVVSLLAVALVIFGRTSGKAGERWAFLSGLIIFATCAMAYVSVRTDGFSSIAPALDDRQWWADGVLPVACVAVAWFALQRNPLGYAGLAGTALAGIAATFVAIPAWDRQALVTQPVRSAFSAWRAAIPIDAEVYWPQHVDVLWFVLQRRSYLSHLQTAGVLFSRDTAMEQLARTAYTGPGLPAPIVFGDGAAGIAFPMDEAGIRKACRIGGPDFVISTIPTPFPDAAPPISARLRPLQVREELRLLECATVRGAGGAAG